MLGLQKDAIKLVPHEDVWAENYQKEKEILQQILGDLTIDIQHIGSTAIPNIVAKPILDVGVGVKDIDAMRAVIPLLEKAGYDVADKIEEKGEVLGRRGSAQIRTCLIHIEVYGNINWENHIIFRDYLLAHPEAAKEYEQLKLANAKIYAGDRKGYVAAKTEFVRNIVEKVKSGNV